MRLRGPLATDPTARMFHVFLVVVAVWMAVAFIATLGMSPLTLRRALVTATVQIGPICALILLRRGYFRHASVVYLVGTWLWATLAASSNGGIRSPVLILYGTLPVSAAWLLGYGATLSAAGVSILTLLVFAVLELTGMSSPQTIPGTPLGIWFARDASNTYLHHPNRTRTRQTS